MLPLMPRAQPSSAISMVNLRLVAGESQVSQSVISQSISPQSVTGQSISPQSVTDQSVSLSRQRHLNGQPATGGRRVTGQSISSQSVRGQSSVSVSSVISMAKLRLVAGSRWSDRQSVSHPVTLLDGDFEMTCSLFNAVLHYVTLFPSTIH